MSDTLQFELHPDADQLTAFSEGLLPKRERLETMAHLADCASCREVVFLAQEATPEAAIVPQPEPAKSNWRSWFSPLAVFGASAALVTCGILIAFTLRTSKTPPNPTPTQMAEFHNAPLPPPPPPPPPPASPRLEPAIPPARPLPPKALQTAPPPPKAAPPAPVVQTGNGMAAGVMGGIAGGTGSGPVSTATAPGYSQLAPADTAAPVARLRANPPVTNAQGNALSSQGILKNNESLDPNTSSSVYHGAMAPAAPAVASAPALKAKAASDSPGTIAGYVRDQTGAIIPGAKVEAKNLTTAAIQTVTTDAHGSFNFASLPSGRYDVSVTAPAFQTFVQQVTVQPQQLAQLTPTLAVGQESETVEVSAANATMDTQQAKTGTVIDQAQVSDLPVDGRNVIALANLLPGVTNVATSLPSKLPAITLASRGKVLLALDTAGTLFRSTNSGKHWKAVEQQWQGKATALDELSQASNSYDAISTGVAPTSSDKQVTKQIMLPTAFQLITSTGAKWTSVDGRHWKPSQK